MRLVDYYWVCPWRVRDRAPCVLFCLTAPCTCILIASWNVPMKALAMCKRDSVTNCLLLFLRQTAIRQFTASVLAKLKVARTCHWYTQSWYDWMVWETIHCTNGVTSGGWIPQGTTERLQVNFFATMWGLTIFHFPLVSVCSVYSISEGSFF